ncbi:Phosphatidylinositol-4-phosphate 5-kinase [Myotisia sp. PD_48]|nr:Phosphatidylinositol-4-phosphate 5-kinase [Myotisia sp. PD_48]
MPAIAQESHPRHSISSSRLHDKTTVSNTFIWRSEYNGDGEDMRSSSDFFFDGTVSSSLNGDHRRPSHSLTRGRHDNTAAWDSDMDAPSVTNQPLGLPNATSIRHIADDTSRVNGVSDIPAPTNGLATTNRVHRPSSPSRPQSHPHPQQNGVYSRTQSPTSRALVNGDNSPHAFEDGRVALSSRPLVNGHHYSSPYEGGRVPLTSRPVVNGDHALSFYDDDHIYSNEHAAAPTPNSMVASTLSLESPGPAPTRAPPPPPPTTLRSEPVRRGTSPPVSEISYIDQSGPSSSPRSPRSLPIRNLQVPPTSSAPRGNRDSSSFLHSNPNPSEDVITLSERVSSPSSGIRRASLNLSRLAARSTHSDIHIDEAIHDEGAARWTEAIKQRRASKRKRREEEDEDRVVVGTKVDQNHVNWVTAYNMLTGIRFTVSRTNAKLDRELTDADFEAKHKFSFDITGNELTPSAKYDFKFKDYAPWVFRRLRSRFQLDPADYLMSLTSKYILSELGSPGKSGSFFYFSRDYKYIIKTIHHAEHKLLRRILREYYQHTENNPNTLISQFYGLHRVKMAYGRKIHFVVMNNLFPPHRDIHHMFDLKGSTVGRDFREQDLADNPRATLKDLNWLRRDRHINCGPMKRDVFLAQLRRDVALLQRLNIMDYSLLIGIHDLEKGNEEKLRDRTLQIFQPGGGMPDDERSNLLLRTPSRLENARKARELREIIKREKPVPMEQASAKMPDEILDERKNLVFYSDDGGFRATHEHDEPGEEIYYLGVIDCLTHYGLVKKAEHFWKGLSHNRTQISPIPPHAYGERFLSFISHVTKSKEEVEREKREEEALAQVANEPESSREHETHPTPEDETEEHPRRILTTIRAPASDVDGPPTTLPVVEEVGESSDRSGSSRDGVGVSDNRTDETADTRRHTFRTDIWPSGPPPELPPPPPKSENGSITSNGRDRNGKAKARDNPQVQEKDLPPIPDGFPLGPAPQTSQHVNSR